MNAVFADTSFYIALLNPRDPAHAKALAFSRQARMPALTTWFVLLELGSALRYGDDRRLYSDFLNALQADPGTTIVPPTLELVRAAAQLFENRPDKEWSLTDCSSFIAMQRAGVTKALTLDHHFAQAGFQILLV